MCATYQLVLDADDAETRRLLKAVKSRYGAGAVCALKGDFFPKMTAPVVGPAGRPALMEWGFPMEGRRQVVFNARGEDLRRRPMFRPYLRNRCLIPATAFYEWDGQKRKRRLRLRGCGLFYMAGLWRPVETADGRRFVFVILTTRPNRTVAAIHNRMPVLIPAELRRDWFGDAGSAGRLLEPLEAPMTVEAADPPPAAGGPAETSAR